MGASANSSQKKGGHSKISVSILDHQKSVILMFTLFIFLLNKTFSYFLAKQIVVFFVVLVATKNQMRSTKFFVSFFLKGGIGK